ncbi:MAG: 50S ribosomal protein L21 [Leptospiraceae bacterium]|nr:50S ribosomal protein L21 [Leptospiraceae bacterium]
MYAYIKLAGHQHKVEADQVFLAEKSGHEAGSEFVCEDVLALGQGDSLKVGKPTVSGASVKLKVLADVRAPKIRGFKYKKRKGYHRTWGHRQDLQRLQVVTIQG